MTKAESMIHWVNNSDTSTPYSWYSTEYRGASALLPFSWLVAVQSGDYSVQRVINIASPPASILLFHDDLTMSAAVSLLSTYAEKVNLNPSFDENGYKRALQDTSWADVGPTLSPRVEVHADCGRVFEASQPSSLCSVISSWLSHATL